MLKLKWDKLWLWSPPSTNKDPWPAPKFANVPPCLDLISRHGFASNYLDWLGLIKLSFPEVMKSSWIDLKVDKEAGTFLILLYFATWQIRGHPFGCVPNRHFSPPVGNLASRPNFSCDPRAILAGTATWETLRRSSRGSQVNHSPLNMNLEHPRTSMDKPFHCAFPRFFWIWCNFIVILTDSTWP